MSNKAYLVDGSGYIFRAYYAISPLSTKDGFPTNALFGFTRMLLKLLSQSDSEHVVVVFDAGRETFRNELYKDYKANRTACPADLVPQFPLFREIAHGLGLTILELGGYEADDVIGTVAKRLEKMPCDVVIVSGDKDLAQLINERVTVWDTLNERHFDAAKVKEKFGVTPEKLTEFLALSGDSSDNVPGLKGVGPKTAAQLVEKYGDIEGIIAAKSKIQNDPEIRNRAKICQQIESDAELVRLSRKLVEIKTDAPVEIPNGEKRVLVSELSDQELYSALQRGPIRHALLDPLVNKLEFTSLIKELKVANDKKNVPVAKYRTIYRQDFGAWVEKFLNSTEFVFDLETTSLDVLEAQVVGIAVAWSSEEAFYIPFAHKQAANDQISFAEFKNVCAKHFAAPNVKKIAHNLKYDLGVLLENGFEFGGASFDSMLAAYLLNPDRGSFSLNSVAKDYLGFDSVEYSDLVGSDQNFSDVGIKEATDYACEDALYTWLLYKKLAPEIEKQNLAKVLYEIELPLIEILSSMERKGIKLDVDLLAHMSEEFGKMIDTSKQQVFALAGTEFNLNSPKQLADVLFVKLGISTKGLKKTKTGISTDSSVLEKLSFDQPIASEILRHRFLFKLKSTYIDALPAQVSKKTKRLHTRFNQTGTSTGRLSSSDPNLQNIPISTSEGSRIRSAFIAEQGNVLISADYSQIELRLLAHLSNDQNLIAAFKSGLDIHAQTTREILGLSPDAEISAEKRRIGKTINFGIIYGMSGFRLARELGLPLNIANKYIEDYFAHYPNVKLYFARVEADALKQGYVETLLGRRRMLGQIDDSGRDKGFIMRATLNAPLQGSAADVVKLAMLRVTKALKKRPCNLLLQIHDELLFECDQAFRDEAMAMIKQEMEKVITLQVPLMVHVGSGCNWHEAH